MSKQSKQSTWKYLILSNIVIAIIMLILGVIVGETLKLYITKIFNKQEISFELVSNIKLSKFELYNIEKNMGLQKFKLNLDDPLLDSYQLLTFNIINDGITVKGPLKFRITLGEQYVKILDIKHKINSPSNKLISITNSIPDLKWSIDEYKNSGRLGTIMFGTSNEFIAGHNIYQSRFNDIGFGKVNNHLVVRDKYTIAGSPLIDDYSSYYSIQLVSVDGSRSNIGNSISLLDTVPFRPYFKDVINVFPDLDINDGKQPTNRQTFRSLKDAMMSGQKGVTYLVYKKKEEARKHIDLLNSTDNNVDVLYLDDIAFMNGTAEILIHDGLDENAVISFYVLYKILPGRDYVFTSIIDGNPDIRYTRRGVASKYNIRLEAPKNVVNSDKQYSLTPYMASSYSGNHGIYIFWTYPKDKTYRGVRIFRKTENDKLVKKHPGNEVYMGPGIHDNIICKWDGSAYARDYSMNKYNQNNADTIMPPRKIQKAANNTKTPAKPTLMSIYRDIMINSYDNTILPYYYDNSVSLGKQYTYTIFAYDNEESYSYPITVITILGNKNETPYCIPVDN